MAYATLYSPSARPLTVTELQELARGGEVRHDRERLSRPVDLSQVPLVDGDLAVEGVRVSDAPIEAIDRALAVAKERHRAINWLLGAAGIYSEVITAT